MTVAVKKTDWEAIEREYRLGQKSLRVLSLQFGPDAATISRRARKDGWVQDKSVEVRERTRAALMLSATAERNAQHNHSTPTQHDIAVAVQTNVELIHKHRSGIGRAMALADKLMAQLQEAADNRGEIEAEIEAETAGDRSPARRDRMMKALSLSSHASILLSLSAALKNLIPMERQAFNLDDNAPPPSPALDLSELPSADRATLRELLERGK